MGGEHTTDICWLMELLVTPLVRETGPANNLCLGPMNFKTSYGIHWCVFGVIIIASHILTEGMSVLDILVTSHIWDKAGAEIKISPTPAKYFCLAPCKP